MGEKGGRNQTDTDTQTQTRKHTRKHTHLRHDVVGKRASAQMRKDIQRKDKETNRRCDQNTNDGNGDQRTPNQGSVLGLVCCWSEEGDEPIQAPEVRQDQKPRQREDKLQKRCPKSALPKPRLLGHLPGVLGPLPMMIAVVHCRDHNRCLCERARRTKERERERSKGNAENFQRWVLSRFGGL